MTAAPGDLVPQSSVILFGGGVALACGLDGMLRAEALQGFFAGDTRVLSTYRLGIGGDAWQLLGRSRLGQASAQWEFQNPRIRDPAGDVLPGTLLLSLRRRLDRVLHDDLTIQSFSDHPLRIGFSLQLDADFADIFQVHDQSLPPRLNIQRIPGPAGLTLRYTYGGFHRGLRIRFEAAQPPRLSGPLVMFELVLGPGTTWQCCLEAAPEIDGATLTPLGNVHGPESDPLAGIRSPLLRAPPLLAAPFARSRADLHALAVPQAGHPPYVAAGVPWFLTLFGRDSLLTALMIGIDGAWAAEGALAALAPLQAIKRDDWRDAEPGKLPHEIRRGELAYRGLIPHTPYYGTHDAPSLYCLALWHAWRWTGDRAPLAAYLETARAALRWCDEYGDRDGDGLQEYGTRSPKGYRNQSWKDAGDAIVDAHGRLAEPPLATVELQGYLFAARLAMAELLQAQGEPEEAERQRRAAAALQARVEARFWLEGERFYALALDRDKRRVTSIESNPGHLLWCGLPSAERAAAVAARLLEPDLFNGWGLRTLSSENPAYDPLLYQRGSVWPHDTALAAAGLWRYGQHEAASRLIRAILEAVARFEGARLPELFCGIGRTHGSPVPYFAANSPQAWAAAVPLLVAQLLLGLVPDAPRQRCFIAPWLPEWLPALEVRDIAIGTGQVMIRISRRGDATVVDDARGDGIEIIKAAAEAPLWGLPPRLEPRGDDELG